MDPAAIRYNNPGAMYPGPSATRFGSTGFGMIGGGHKIAQFPSMEHGAAAQFDLLDRNYAGMPLRSAIQKWSGGNSSDAYAQHVASQTGLSLDAPISREFIRDPATGVKLVRAMSSWEAGRPMPLDDAGWARAHGMAFAGAPVPASQPQSGQPSMYGMINRPQPQQAQPQGVQVADVGGISPEHMDMLAKMGLLPQASRTPQNFGEGLADIGNKINQSAWRGVALQGMREQDAKNQAAWAGYATPGRGMIGQPSSAPAHTAAPQAPAVMEGRDMPPMTGAAPPSTPVAPGGMINPSVPQAPAQPPADPRIGQINDEMERLKPLLANPSTRQFAMGRMGQLEQLLYQINDPAKAVALEGAQLDLQSKRRELENPAGKLTTVPEGASLIVTDPRTGQHKVVVGGEGSQGKEFDKASAKNMAETYQGYIGEGQKAVTATADLERLRELSGVVGTGKLGQWTPKVGPWLQSIGVDVKGLSEAQAFEAIANKMAPAMRPSGSGATSDRDMQIYMSSIPQLSQTPEGRRLIIEQFQAFHEYNKARADIASKVMTKKMSLDQGEQAIGKLADPFARFKERTGLGGGNQQGQTGALQPGGHYEYDPASGKLVPKAAAQPAPAAVNPTGFRSGVDAVTPEDQALADRQANLNRPFYDPRRIMFNLTNPRNAIPVGGN